MSNTRIIERLVQLGPFPGENDATEVEVQAYEDLLHALEKPVSDDDARRLVPLFGDGDLFGLAWTTLHLVETAPGWPLLDCLTNTSNEWTSRLLQRLENTRRIALEARAVPESMN